MYRKALAAAWLLAASACVDSPMVDAAPDPVRMETEEVSMDRDWSNIRFTWALPYLLEGETRYVDATVFDRLGREVGEPPVEFSASDPTLIDVAADGAVTGLKAGAVEVIARVGSLETRLAVDVESADAAWFRLSQDYIELTWLDQAEVFVTPYNEDDRELAVDVEWSSLDPAIATVRDGVIYPLAPGYTHVEARSGDAHAVVRVHVVSPPATYLQVVSAPRYLSVGDRDIVVAEALAQDRRVIEDATLEFESLQPGVLWIEPETGRIKALSEGLAKISIRSGEVRANYQITVRPPTPN